MGRRTDAVPVEGYSVGGWLVAGLGGMVNMVERARETGVPVTAEKRDEFLQLAERLTAAVTDWPTVTE